MKKRLLLISIMALVCVAATSKLSDPARIPCTVVRYSLSEQTEEVSGFLPKEYSGVFFQKIDDTTFLFADTVELGSYIENDLKAYVEDQILIIEVNKQIPINDTRPMGSKIMAFITCPDGIQITNYKLEYTSIKV